MRITEVLSIASLAQTVGRHKEQRYLRTDLIIKYSRIIPAAGLLCRLLWSFVLRLIQLLFRVLAPSVACLVSGNLLSQKNGVMGLGAAQGRRSKQTPKCSSTVLCDSVASLEDWKQQIKAKGSIPANQQRLIFTSQRLIKQPSALTNYSQNQQWQILVDSSVEDICSDLSCWRAVLHSKNTKLELFSPLVLKETDETSFNFHSRSAEELRQFGVPCNVFFLLFNKCVTKPKSETAVVSPLIGDPLDLAFKIDDKFEEDSFLVDLIGFVSGLTISIPFSYVMSGKEVASKLLMIEQTAQYRKQQKKRYQELASPVLKDSLKVKENLSEVNCWDSYHILPFVKNYEYAVCISKDDRQLRCFVFPVITIPLYGTKSMEEQGSLHTLNCKSSNMVKESSSGILALPSTSQKDCESSSGIRAASHKGHASNMEAPIIKPAKKKKKKKSKKSSKQNSKDIVASDDNCADRSIGSDVPNKKMPGQRKLSLELDKDAKKALENTCPRPEISSTVAINEVTVSRDCLTQNLFVNDFERDHAVQAYKDDNFLVEPSSAMVVDKPLIPGFSAHNSGMTACIGPQLSSNRDEQLEVKEGDNRVESSHRDQQLEVKEGFMQDNLSNETTSIPLINWKTEGDDRHCKMLNNVEELPSKDKFIPPNRETHIDHGQGGSKSQMDGRRDHLSRNKPSRDGFWTKKAAERYDFSTQRNKSSQNSTNSGMRGDLKSPVPFWRHQRNDVNRTSQSWSRPTRQDEWSVERGAIPGPRQIRNPTWEQLPDLRQHNGLNRDYTNHWSSFGKVDPSFHQGLTYSSFSMHRNHLGKNNSQYPKRWLADNISNDASHPIMNLNVVPLPPHTSGPIVPGDPAICKNSDVSNSSDIGWAKNTENDFADKKRPVSTIGNASGTHMGNQSSTSQNSPIDVKRDASDVVTANEISKVPDILISNEIAHHAYDMVDAVCASCQSRTAYEKIVALAGTPLCEFEKVAKAVAPVFQNSLENHPQHVIYAGCPCMDEVSESCESLKLQQVAEVPLSAIWDWYEEPSCFGLEVKLTEIKNNCTTKLAENQFQAFFVPYLSAIQIFGWSSQNNAGRCQDIDSLDNDTLNQPQQRYHETPRNTIVSCQNEHGSESHSICARPRQCNCEVELLYEFFEAEKPQQRRPLIERIKQLVMNHVPLESYTSGDASILNSMKLGQLHPSSWFAVAWYPIYRIPDGSFRSAFLTYHSLSSLRLGGQNSDNATVTLPVVGLMSYNAPAKDWFSLKKMSEDHEGIFNGKPHEILHNHLAKLDVAASCMAKGGNQSNRHKHFDYDFFQSRGR